MISRSDAVQGLLDRFERPHYLEIGVSEGATFHAVRAVRKVAVDPKFLFEPRPAPGIFYHEITSDGYFGSVAGRDEMFQVIYLDELHTFEQTLRDLINAASHLAQDGIILVDDVLPNSYAAALPEAATARSVRQALGQSDPSWMGDVYKLVFFVQSFFQSFSYATIADNHGQMVLWRQPRAQVVPRQVADFAMLGFADVVLQRDCFQMQPYAAILDQLASAGRA